MTLTVADKLVQNGINVNKKAMLWGAQGPDFLYYHNILSFNPRKNIRYLGHTLHEMDPQKLFDLMLQYIKENSNKKDNIILKSYAFGFLTHLMLDFYAHPFVYSFQDELAEKLSANPRFMHHKIEHNIDVEVLTKLYSKPVSKFNIKKLLPYEYSVISVQAKMLTYVINSIQPNIKISCKSIIKAYKDCRFEATLLSDRWGVKRKVAKIIEKNHNLGISLSCFVRTKTPQTDWDYLNEGHSTWISKDIFSSKPSTQTFWDVYQNAIDESFECCLKFNDCVNLRQPICFLDRATFNCK